MHHQTGSIKIFQGSKEAEIKSNQIYSLIPYFYEDGIIRVSEGLDKSIKSI